MPETTSNGSTFASIIAAALALGNFWRVRGRLNEWRSGRGSIAHWQLAALSNQECRPNTLQEAGTLARCQGDYATATTRLEERLARWRVLDDPCGIAWTLAFLADAVGDGGDDARATAHLEESVSLLR
jgi:hypothetical protein